MEDVLIEVQQLKRSAVVKTKIDRFDDALKDLAKAISLLEAEMKNVDKIVNEPSPFVIETANGLADCHGTMGGIYQRLGPKHYQEAEQEYKQGFYYEKKYNLDNTYNRSNLIVIRILQGAGNAKKQNEAISKAITVLRKQTEMRRRNEWWAWADLGMLLLLNNDLDEARSAYQQFKNAGAQRQNYDSHIAILKRLHVVTHEAKLPLANHINTVIQELEKDKPPT